MKELLQKYSLKPSKRLGQNFLINKGIIKKIIAAADLRAGDVVLEIGPGLGALTKELAKTAKKVVAVEKDKKLIPLLKEELKGYNNIQIINSDILKIRGKQISADLMKYKIIANLPFYITAPVIRMFLEDPPSGRPPEEMVLVVQKEVAQRITAKPPKMSILAAAVQFYAQVQTISYILKGSFWPAPKTDSAIIKITPFSPAKLNKLSPSQKKVFFKIVRAGFSHPRKQLANNFSKELNIEKKIVEQWLKKNKINPKQRAEALDIANWRSLYKTIPV